MVVPSNGCKREIGEGWGREMFGKDNRMRDCHAGRLTIAIKYIKEV